MYQTHYCSGSAAAPASGLGTLRPAEDSRTAVRFERRFAHSPAKVWRAIVELELRPGARLRFGSTPEQQRRFGIPEDQASYGEVTQVDPPHRLEYTWGDEILRWELRADGDGGCLLVFTNIIDTREVSPDLAAGWHAGLEIVEAQLDSREITWSVWDRAQQLREEYARAFNYSGEQKD